MRAAATSRLAGALPLPFKAQVSPPRMRWAGGLCSSRSLAQPALPAPPPACATTASCPCLPCSGTALPRHPWQWAQLQAGGQQQRRPRRQRNPRQANPSPLQLPLRLPSLPLQLRLPPRQPQLQQQTQQPPRLRLQHPRLRQQHPLPRHPHPMPRHPHLLPRKRSLQRMRQRLLPRRGRSPALRSLTLQR